MLDAFINDSVACIDAVEFAESHDLADFEAEVVAREHACVLAPARREDGIRPNQIEFKTRRLANSSSLRSIVDYTASSFSANSAARAWVRPEPGVSLPLA